jgi:hypothetical protein
VIIPDKLRYFVIVIASVEGGVTGVRDALVTAKLGEQGRLDPTKTDAAGRLQGWFRDPYDSSFDSTAINSVADGEEYDSLVPSHPLSKVRRMICKIRDSMVLER